MLIHWVFWSSCYSGITLSILTIRMALNEPQHVWEPQFPMSKMKDLESIDFFKRIILFQQQISKEILQ